MIDEINATIKSIKKELINIGFDGEKLEIAIGGGSAGAHLALLYPYGFLKNSEIPIKFVINMCGPVTLDDYYYIQLKNFNDTFDNIDSNSIEKGRKEDKFITISESMPGQSSKQFLAMLLNSFLGKDPFEDFDQLYDEKNDTIIYSEKYYEIFKKINYSLPIFYIDENTIPTLNIYGGRDNVVGIGQYAYLEDQFIEHKNKNFTLVYSRYAGHLPIEIETENGIEKLKEMNYQILEYGIKYFTKN
jgi:pimeloyl-ACP methyl ester carboxylesterase